VDDVGVQAEARVVDEDPSVDLADVDRPGLSARQDRDRVGELERDAEVLGEVVQRAERENSEDDAGVDQRCRDRAHRAVAAAGDDRARSPGDGAVDGRRDLVAAVRELYLGLQAGGLEVAGEPVDEGLVVAAARAGVDDDDDGVAAHGDRRTTSGASSSRLGGRGENGARRQNAVSALRHSASQATPSTNAAPTSLR
jgi:hypothetical protein